MDQDTRGRGIIVDFFSLPAYTQIGAIELHLKTGAILLPGFIHRQGPFKHKIEIGSPLIFEKTGDKEKDWHAGTQLINQVIEAQIRAHPSEWMWMHRRWRRGLEWQKKQQPN